MVKTDDSADFFEQVNGESSCKELSEAEKQVLAGQEVSHNHGKIFRYFHDGVSITCHLCARFMLLQTGEQADGQTAAAKRINAIIEHIGDRHVTRGWLHRKYE